jgi:GWxTD domain-containing protein
LKRAVLDVPLLLAALAAIAVGPAWSGSKPPSMADLDAPKPEWRHGPVWYILSDEEDRAYKKLATAEERRAFVEAFWARRDPTPWSIHNELREEFWRRVEESNRLFAESIKPGWKTERGKLFILFGPPKDFHTFEQFQGKRRDFRWRYESRDLPPEVIEVMQSTLSPPFSPIGALGDTVLRPPQSPLFEEFLTRLMEQGLRGGDLAKMMRLPVSDDHLDEIITTSEFYNSLPVHAVYDYYASSGGSTFCTLTLSVPERRLPLERPERAGDASIVMYAKMVHEQDRDLSYSFTNRLDATTADDISKLFDDGQMVFQAKGDLRPGRYRFYFGMEVTPAGLVSFFRDTVNVPALEGEDLALSSITLLSRIERSPEGYDDRKIPFILGAHKVVPRATRAYRNGQTLSVYYEVYQARPHPKTGRPSLDIEYQFHVRDQGKMVRIGNPFYLRDVSEPVQRWSFPLSRWPAAEYRLDVKVTDKVKGEVATREAFFFIEPD